MFGRVMNGFEHWTRMPDDNQSDETAMMLKRAYEIQTHHQSTIPAALETIENAQKRQKTIQNNREKPTESTLPIGSTVYIRNLKIERNKQLKPDAHGPFMIKGRASGGNYVLEKVNGQTYRENLPLSRLKLVASDPDEKSFDIEYVVDHRKRHGHLEYLVKWEGFATSENSWVKEHLFDSVECIQEYWDKKTAPPTSALTVTRDQEQASVHRWLDDFLQPDWYRQVKQYRHTGTRGPRTECCRHSIPSLRVSSNVKKHRVSRR